MLNYSIIQVWEFRITKLQVNETLQNVMMVYIISSEYEKAA